MRDNLSIVITVIVLVTLIVLFPLYNYYERQDDMSYNLVLKETTNFVDEVLNYGYISQERYNQYVASLANTGNYYEIELEALKRQYTKLSTNSEYIEEYVLDNNKDILKQVADPKNMAEANVLKDNYTLNQGDQFYIKLKNSNTTLAGALFNTIVPGTAEKRIAVNYGGIVKNNAWQNVFGQFTATNSNIKIGDDYNLSYEENEDTKDNVTFKYKKDTDVEYNDEKIEGISTLINEPGVYVIIALDENEVVLDTLTLTIVGEEETNASPSEEPDTSGDDNGSADDSLEPDEEDESSQEGDFISDGEEDNGFDNIEDIDEDIDDIIFDDSEIDWEDEDEDDLEEEEE